MPDSRLSAGCLVLYKTHAALLTQIIADKFEIQLEKGKPKKVRDKDIVFLHPGPFKFDALTVSAEPAIDDAIELLEGEESSLEDLSELLFEEFTPATAWATWALLRDGLYFEGDVDAIIPRSESDVAAELAVRNAKLAEQQEWDDFISHVEAGKLEDADRKRLAEVERVALGTSNKSKILTTFKVSETQEAAHAFLIRCGYWQLETNPWPRRVGVLLEQPDQAVPALPEEDRRDLTHLKAWAIDDEGNQDPDDAISLDGDRLWVHVADVAALVRPGGHLDQAARARAANLYLPEQVWTMLPPGITEQLGLGLAEISPALSFGFVFDGEKVTDIEVTPSLVKVTRTTYGKVDTQLDSEDFSDLKALTDRYRDARFARNAARLDFPEVNVHVVDGKVEIRPYGRIGSRDLVTDAMLMAGEAAARYATEHGITIPYAMQPEPSEIQHPKLMSEMYTYRRQFKPSKTTFEPEPHFGLGLSCYARTTSPLRRYADLIVHQQLRAHATGGQVMDAATVSERVTALDGNTRLIRKAERLSNQHWKHVFLKQNPKWKGEAIVVSLEERKAVIIAEDLAYETKIRLVDGLKLDGKIKIGITDVDIPAGSAFFRVLK